MDENLRKMLDLLLGKIDYLMANMATKADIAELRAEQDVLRATQEAMLAEQKAMRAEQKAMRVDIDSGRSIQDVMRAEAKERHERLVKEIQETQRIMGANYYRLSGRVDQIGNMLNAHIAGHTHGTPVTPAPSSDAVQGPDVLAH